MKISKHIKSTSFVFICFWAGMISNVHAQMMPIAYRFYVNQVVTPVRLEGSIFYATENNYQKGGIILLNGDEVSNLNVRYDLYSQSLDIKENETIRSLGPNQIAGFFIDDAKGVKYFKVAPPDMVKKLKLIEGSFLQSMKQGKPFSLFRYSYISILNPTYKPQFNIGNKNYQAQRVDHYIVASGDSYEDLKKFNKRRKKKFLKNQHIDKDKMNELINMPTDTESECIAFVEQLNHTLIH